MCQAVYASLKRSASTETDPFLKPLFQFSAYMLCMFLNLCVYSNEYTAILKPSSMEKQHVAQSVRNREFNRGLAAHICAAFIYFYFPPNVLGVDTKIFSSNQG